jgi:O-antigen/teichoic acid export membrane protein
MFKQLATQSAWYAVGAFCVSVASLINFPLLTRALSVSEYGTFSLLMTSILLLTVLGKMGFQHASVMSQNDAHWSKTDSALPSTLVFCLFIHAFFLSLIVIIGLNFTNQIFGAHLPFIGTLVLSLALFCRIFQSSAVNLFKIEGQAHIIVAFNLLNRWGFIVLFGASLLLFQQSLLVPLIVLAIAEIFATCFLFVQLNRRFNLKLKAVNSKNCRYLWFLGVPLMVFEGLSVLSDVSERYLIQFLLGSEQVGFYSAVYNLCDQLQVLMTSPIEMAFLPLFTRLLNEQNQEQALSILKRSLQIFLYLAIAMIFGIWAVGADLLHFLASEKYAPAITLIPWLMVGTLIKGSLFLFACHLYAKKRSYLLMLLFGLTLTLNLSLNWLLIPFWGLTGSAIAKIISYTTLISLCIWLSRKELSYNLDFKRLICAFILGLCMWQGLSLWQFESAFLTLISKILAGAIFYLGFLMLIDSTARHWIQNRLKLKV